MAGAGAMVRAGRCASVYVASCNGVNVEWQRSAIARGAIAAAFASASRGAIVAGAADAARAEAEVRKVQEGRGDAREGGAPVRPPAQTTWARSGRVSDFARSSRCARLSPCRSARRARGATRGSRRGTLWSGACAPMQRCTQESATGVACTPTRRLAADPNCGGAVAVLWRCCGGAVAALWRLLWRLLWQLLWRCCCGAVAVLWRCCGVRPTGRRSNVRNARL